MHPCLNKHAFTTAPGLTQLYIFEMNKTYQCWLLKNHWLFIGYRTLVRNPQSLSCSTCSVSLFSIGLWRNVRGNPLTCSGAVLRVLYCLYCLLSLLSLLFCVHRHAPRSRGDTKALIYMVYYHNTAIQKSDIRQCLFKFRKVRRSFFFLKGLTHRFSSIMTLYAWQRSQGIYSHFDSYWILWNLKKDQQTRLE